MIARFKLTALLGFGLLALGCSAPLTSPAIPAPAVAAGGSPATSPPALPAPVPSLTFLLEPDRFGPPLSRAATTALRDAMEAAGYRVVVDPISSFDAELLLRVFVWGREIDPSRSEHGVATTNEHVRFTLVAVAQGRIVALSHTYGDARDGVLQPDQMTQALLALGRSEKLQALEASVQREQQAAIRAAAIASSERAD